MAIDAGSGQTTSGAGVNVLVIIEKAAQDYIAAKTADASVTLGVVERPGGV